MSAIGVNTLLSEGACYTCYAPGDVPEMAKIALLSRIAGLSPEPPPEPPCIAPPDAPVINQLTLPPINYTITWSAPAGAVSYLVDLAEPEPPWTFFVFENEPTPTNSLAVTDVTDALRAVRVKALNACGESAWSETMFFTVGV